MKSEPAWGSNGTKGVDSAGETVGRIRDFFCYVCGENGCIQMDRTTAMKNCSDQRRGEEEC